MACRAVERWTLTSLVGAYLDLALAYLFLIGATVAFLSAKLLSLLGLSLPCSCDGRFGHPACAQTSLLVEFPTARIADVHRSVRSRFPFDSLLPTGAGVSSSPGVGYDLRYPSEDGDSCCSVSPVSSRPRSLGIEATLLPVDPMTEESSVQIIAAGRQSNIRDSISDHEKPFSSEDPWDFDDDGMGEDAEAGEKEPSFGVVGCDEEVVQVTMSSLERELEEERGARAALYLELEKERSAAASAADEAMAMILRLQKEKAKIDMESRQYQRMIEEKYAYDAEEMEILKEIIVRRETEKLVLEKEVQMYKQMVNSEGNEQAFDTDDSFLEGRSDMLVDSSSDPLLMLQQIYRSIVKKEGFVTESSEILNSSGVCSNHDKFVDARNLVDLFDNEADCDQEFQEKSMLTAHNKALPSDNLNSFSAENSVLCDLNGLVEDEYQQSSTNLTVKDEDKSENLFVMGDPYGGPCKVGTDGIDNRCTEYSHLQAEASILDVHVIDDQVLEIQDDNNRNSSASKEEESCTNFDEMELNIRRSCSEITNRISLIDSLSGRASYCNLRSSLPFVETERYKFENEVEDLRKRLEIIRQGREKLSLYADQKEKETYQLQLLDEIADQLKEIKKVTEPIRNLRRVSLPLPSSKFKVKN